jgi:hypothetical protein
VRVLEGFFDECHGFRFDSEATRVMGVAFEMALVALRHTDGVDPPRDAVARKIIELAKAGERDPERLSEGVLQQWGRAIAHTSRRPQAPGDQI